MSSLTPGTTMKKLTIGQKIKHCRLNKGWSQRTLATKIGVTHNRISYYENGQINPSYKTIVKILRVLDLPPDQLLEGRENVTENGTNS